MRYVRFGGGSSVLAFLCMAVALLPLRAIADPQDDPQFLHVTVSLGGTEPERAGQIYGFDTHPALSREQELRRVTGLRTTLPDSVRFAGLAGALNLAIDTSTGSPRIEGIALAPRETLRFAAGSQEIIRGIQGHISIRLDF